MAPGEGSECPGMAEAGQFFARMIHFLAEEEAKETLNPAWLFQEEHKWAENCQRAGCIG